MTNPTRQPEFALPPASSTRALAAVASVVLGSAVLAAALQTILSDFTLAASFTSQATWLAIVESLGGSVEGSGRELIAVLDYWKLLAALTVGSAAVLCAVGISVVVWPFPNGRLHPRTAGRLLLVWAARGWAWWLLLAPWEVGRILALLGGDRPAAVDTLHILLAVAPFLFAAVAALWGWTWWQLITAHTGPRLSKPASDPKSATEAATVPATDSADLTLAEPHWRATCGLSLMVLVATAVLTWMNWQLYRGMWIPHGDSAMYEEHLWNLLHGKGFRSYLDQGLFLGEHIQVVHVLLVPIYAIWPSHLLLELCESFALAVAAVPIYRLAVWHTHSRRCGLLLAAGWLCYFPMHYLDIAIDFKTFRPIVFGIPFFLAMLDQLERGRFKTAGVWALLTLSCKEDFAIPLAMIGVWLVWRGVVLRFWKQSREQRPDGVRGRWVTSGVVWIVFSTGYLALVVFVLLPYFRDGAEPHYVAYYTAFGDSMSEVMHNMLTNPALLLRELARTETLLYALALFLPVAGLSILSPTRVAVGLPLFILLCVNEISRYPQHHFHAPIVPIAFWSAAAGLRTLCRSGRMQSAARLAWSLSFTTALLYSMTPLGLTFWDPGSHYYWKNWYRGSERARAFEQIEHLIPADARVASTDYVHTRLTHRERSYDYSDYRRRVSGYEDRVPDDTDYIVIDRTHYNSAMRNPDDVRELQREPERWEIVPHEQMDYFIVLRRRNQAAQ